jgi:hypothetical protein
MINPKELQWRQKNAQYLIPQHEQTKATQLLQKARAKKCIFERTW